MGEEFGAVVFFPLLVVFVLPKLSDADGFVWDAVGDSSGVEFGEEDFVLEEAAQKVEAFVFGMGSSRHNLPGSDVALEDDEKHHLSFHGLDGELIQIKGGLRSVSGVYGGLVE